MSELQPPRAFLSYRHTERSGTADADAHNRQHVEWVEQFAHDLAAFRVEPVLDARVRQLVGPLYDTDLATEPAIANLTLASIHVCHAFLPILTPGWVERIGYGGFEAQRTWQDGYVFDEWQQAAASAQAGKIQIVPILRTSDTDKVLALPLIQGAGILFDFTDDAPYEQNLALLADFLHTGRAIACPAVDMKLRDWLIEFLQRMEDAAREG